MINQLKRRMTETFARLKLIRPTASETIGHGGWIPIPQMETNLCTVERRGRVHLITLTGAGDHRLSPALLTSIRSAVAASAGAGALVLAAEGKYFSNGFDQAWARTAPPHLHATMDGGFRALVADLLAVPMPTVAAVTGHAAAAGCALALAHDSVVMRGSRGFLYMSEVDAGIKIVDFVAELLREKVPDAVARRDLVLRGDKMTAAEAVRRGIVDAAVHGRVEDVVAAAVAAAEKLAARGWNGEVVAEIRKATWPAVWNKVKDHGADASAPAQPRL
ncbi:enoyl-CoA delta isomerase 2, peroxisomal-like [Phragmites australis]|uniref:enoyl-CoA delta isomerase 2, peroxisomal-like n=1 Tax=Phragmites australis TaxID=29695 RepID=UPI002D79F0E2|nr:enoyl-CoA delta isomerase 2, peroxisomal-like [Phragmites australis]